MFPTTGRRRGQTLRTRRLGAMSADWCEALEARQLLSDGPLRVLALTTDNTMVEFAHDAPQTLLRTVPITGLDSNMVVLGIDFRPSDGRLYGLYTRTSGVGSGFFDIDPRTGAAGNFRQFTTSVLIRNAPAGIDFEAASNSVRMLEDSSGRVTRFNIGANSATAAGAPVLPPTDPLAFINDPAGTGGASVRIFTIDAASDTLRRFVANEGFFGSETVIGPLGVDVQGPYAGFDRGDNGQLFAAVRVAGTTRFGTINSADGGFTQLGGLLAGDGLAQIRDLAIWPVNRAPRLSTEYSPALPALRVGDDPAANTGITVLSLVTTGAGPAITDADPYDPRGIAITGLDTSGGTWQYQFNGGGWVAMAAASAADALLLPADNQTRIRFVPDTGYNGVIAIGLTFRAWDGSEGTVGGRLDATSTGGSTPISAESRSVRVTVVAPAELSGIPGRFDVNDNQNVRLLPALAIAWDGDAAESFVLDVNVLPSGAGVFTVASLNASGFVRLTSAPGTYRFTGTVAQAVAAARLLVFNPADNRVMVGGTTTAFFDLSLVGGGFAPVAANGPMVVATSVNNTPTITGIGAPKFVRAGSTVRPFLTTTIRDVDPGQVLTTTVRIDKPGKGTITAASLRASGFVKIGPKQFRFVGTAAAATVAVRKLRLQFNAGLPTTPAQVMNFTLRVNDGLVDSALASTRVTLRP